MVPGEILKLINGYATLYGNINLFKTCKYFYYYKDIFYQSYIFDYNKISILLI